ncbi:hypothetical protein BGX28_001004, partial [Mortierella sp. GBA30]
MVASFRVVSYNLLSNTLVQLQKDKYTGFDPDPTNWASRRELLLDELQQMAADIYCVQELDYVDFKGEFGGWMDKLGFAGQFQKRHLDQEFGCAIFYRRQNVKMAAIIDTRLDEGETITGVQNAGILMLFEIQVGPKSRLICVGTTHLVCNDSRGFTQLGQLVKLVSEAQVQMKRDPCTPLILTGDFNAFSKGLLCRYVARGSVDLSKISEVRFAKPGLHLTKSAMSISQGHLDRCKAFKIETWGARSGTRLSPEYKTMADRLRDAIRQMKDLRNGVIKHDFHMSSVYHLGSAVDYIFH